MRGAGCEHSGTEATTGYTADGENTRCELMFAVLQRAKDCRRPPRRPHAAPVCVDDEDRVAGTRTQDLFALCCEPCARLLLQSSRRRWIALTVEQPHFAEVEGPSEETPEYEHDNRGGNDTGDGSDFAIVDSAVSPQKVP